MSGAIRIQGSGEAPHRAGTSAVASIIDSALLDIHGTRPIDSTGTADFCHGIYCDGKCRDCAVRPLVQYARDLSVSAPTGAFGPGVASLLSRTGGDQPWSLYSLVVRRCIISHLFIILLK
jgi:hypothetical protein